MFHKEGFNTITITSIIIVGGILLAESFLETYLTQKIVQVGLLVLFLLVLQFFRNPKRSTQINEQHIIAPADGKVVVIEEVFEPEYFQDKRLQVSIFMSPINVHVTRYPISGLITYSKHHPGKYLVSRHPKSSTKNERTTIVINTKNFDDVMYRQIAGTFAKRIVNYAKDNNVIVQGEDAGFIKFGSRIDLFLPLNTTLHIKLGDKVKGGEQIIASK